jgi:uncharacterized protein (UPF0548 family)
MLGVWALAPTPARAQTLSFTAPSDYAVGANPQWVAVGDFDGGGVQDLAVANASSNTVSVLLGNGEGTFQAARTVATGRGPTAVAVGDFNGDGNPDLVTANLGTLSLPNNTVSVLLGNGEGTFQAARDFLVGTNPNFVAVGDFNGDGVQDLATANFGGNTPEAVTVSVLLGNGDGTFQAARTVGVDRGPLWVAVGDFNGDGNPDLVTANFGSTTVSVLLGNGDGTFQAARHFPAGAGGPASVAVGDFNRDGRQDLAVTLYGDGSGTTLAVLLGNGDGTFPAPVVYGVGVGPVSVAVGDFNGDGVQDLATANWDRNAGRTVSVLLGNGDGTFQAAQNFLAGQGVAAVAVGDFNRDGAQDLATGNYAVGTVSVLINTGSQAVTLLALTVNPASVTGGGASTGTVTLSGPAPSGGAVVSLSSDNPGVATVPGEVTVPESATSATFPVSTAQVSTSTSVTLSATYNSGSQTATLTVTPSLGVAAVSLSPNTVVGGTASTGTVTLTGPAPSGGAAVALASSNPGVATVPGEVTVPAGATSATFPVSTTPVGTLTSVTISAASGGVTRTATLTVTPPTLAALSLSPATVTGGSPSTGTVTLNGPAPSGGAVVSLSSSNILVAMVPPSGSVTVPAGSTSATFTVTTLPVLFPTTVTISASYRGTTRTANLTVSPGLMGAP